ncbi:MAG: multicopper oxidase family protein [Vicinamibacterales bacterium]
MFVTRRAFVGVGAAVGATYLAARGFTRWAGAPLRASAQSASRDARLASVDGRLDVDLVASDDWVDLADGRAKLWSFNGQVPGPLLEAAPGDEVRIHLTNNLDESTNLHFHGLHVPPTGTGDNIFLEVPPGEVASYAFRIPEEHPAGLFWLHPHLHGSVARQVSLGLAAPLVIRGALDALPEVAAAREHLLVLQDFELDRSGRPIDPGMGALMGGREGALVTVSGQTQPRYAIEQDGLLRLRLLNASASRFYRLSLEGHAMHIIATDGGSLAVPQQVDELLLAPGERRDVLILGSGAGGVYRLMNLPYHRGSAGMMGGTLGSRVAFEIASVVYEGRAASPRRVPEALGDVERLPAARMRRTFVLSETMGMIRGRGMGMRFLINGREFDHTRIDDRVRLGDIEEWEYINNTDMDHPMHVHTNAFQRVGADGQAEPAWLDGIVVPARRRERIRIRFADFVGATVQHCHILDHEDLGMMSTMQVEG